MPPDLFPPALLIPLWEAPDVIWHFAFIQHFAAGGGLPERADAGLRAPWRQEGSQPPLYYLLAAPSVARVGDDDADAVIRFNPHAAVGLADPGGNPNRMVHGAAENLPWRGTVLAARLVNVLGLLWGALALWGTCLTLCWHRGGPVVIRRDPFPTGQRHD